MSTAIVWFRNDLRVKDNPVLRKAVDTHDSVIPVYVFDDHFFGTTSFGFAKTGAFRAQFLLEAVQDLQASLKELGGMLYTRKGNTVSILSALQQAFDIDRVYAQKEVTAEEVNLEQKVAAALDVPLELIWTSTLYHPEDLPFSQEQIPNVFTQFRKQCEKKSRVREAINAPESIPCPTGLEDTTVPTITDLVAAPIEKDARSVLSFKGGEKEAWKRLEYYFWQSKELSFYKQKRNGLLGENYSSKFSAWLTHGCISPVSIYHEVKRYETEVVKNSSTYWLVFELLWRDYFRYVCLRHGNSVFHKNGIFKKELRLGFNKGLFEKWRTGNTGVPFVDANMKELLLTGFMSNRGRQNAASFLVKDMQQDWRAGAEWFESQLIDYDVCSNYGNWNYVAGTGNDPREDRYFNVVSQAKRYDAGARYIKTWLPELASYGAADAIAPWQAQNLFPVEYPSPIVKGRFLS